VFASIIATEQIVPFAKGPAFAFMEGGAIAAKSAGAAVCVCMAACATIAKTAAAVHFANMVSKRDSASCVVAEGFALTETTRVNASAAVAVLIASTAKQKRFVLSAAVGASVSMGAPDAAA
jgi:hypothetical protein